MPLRIIHSDITQVQADVIVNSANPYPICGGSTEGCIYEAAGYDELLEARQKVGYLEVGEVALTSAFHLDATYLIHVSAPRWNNGRSGEKMALKICYQKVLKLAQDSGCRSVAFSLLSSGAYRFPKDVAMTIAKDAIDEFPKVNAPDDSDESMDVMLVLYDDEAIKVSESLFNQIQNYIDANYVPEDSSQNLHFNRTWEPLSAPSKFQALNAVNHDTILPRREEVNSECVESPRLSKTKADFKKSIDEMLADSKNLKSFSDRMSELMRERNISATTIERDGNIDRKHFSKILSKKINPSKEAVIAIAIGLKLNYLEAVDFLAYANRALSPSSRSDLIVKFFMENKELFYRENPAHNKYKVVELNDILMQHGEDTLGAGKNLK